MKIPLSIQPFVSVIVPARSTNEALYPLLEALDHQQYPAERFEVIVVDDGSEPPIQKVADFNLNNNIRIIRIERSRGSYAARNRGLQVARGEVLAFTDADCIPEADWIAQGAAALTHTSVVGGALIFTFQSIHPTACELFDAVTYMQQDRLIQRQGIAVTANLFVHRKVFDKVGKFNAELLSGGDGEWCRRATEGGFALSYAPQARVRHRARSTFREVWQKTRRVTDGFLALEQTSSSYQWKRPPGRLLPSLHTLHDKISHQLITSRREALKVLAVTIALHLRTQIYLTLHRTD